MKAALKGILDRMSMPRRWRQAGVGWLVALLLLFLPIQDRALAWSRTEAALVGMLVWPMILFVSPQVWLVADRGPLGPWYRACATWAAFTALATPFLTFWGMALATNAGPILEGHLSALFTMRFSGDPWVFFPDHMLGLWLILQAVGLAQGRVMAAGEQLQAQAGHAEAQARKMESVRRPFEPEVLSDYLDALADRAATSVTAVEEELLDLADSYRNWLEDTRWLDGPKNLAPAVDPGDPAPLDLVVRRLQKPWVQGVACGWFLLGHLALWANGTFHGMPWSEGLTLGLRVALSALWLPAITPLPWQLVPPPRGWPLGLVTAPVLVAFRLFLDRALGGPPTQAGGIAWMMVQDGGIGYLIARRESLRARWALARTRNSEAYQRLLMAQLEPHALMNALNDLSELLHEDPARGAQGLRDLAAFHRELQAAASRESFTLGEERRLVQAFLSVSAIRWEGCLELDGSWDPQLDEVKALPLVVQPLVENAVKYGLGQGPHAGRITVVARLMRDQAVIRVTSPFRAGTPGRSGTGVGLRNLRGRLAHMYGDRASLATSMEEGCYIAILTLPAERP